MTIDELIRDVLDKDELYYEAERASKRAYEATAAALTERQKAYDRLRLAAQEGQAYLHGRHAVHKDSNGTLYVIPLAD